MDTVKMNWAAIVEKAAQLFPEAVEVLVFVPARFWNVLNLHTAPYISHGSNLAMMNALPSGEIQVVKIFSSGGDTWFQADQREVEVVPEP